EEVLDDAVSRAEERPAEEARLTRLLVRFFGADPESWAEEVERETARAIPIFEAAGDDRALAKAWRLLASVHGRACRFEEEAKAGRQAMEHARRAGDRRQELRSAARTFWPRRCRSTRTPSSSSRATRPRPSGSSAATTTPSTGWARSTSSPRSPACSRRSCAPRAGTRRRTRCA